MKAGADELALRSDKAVGEAAALEFGQKLVVRLGEGKGVADGSGAAGSVGLGLVPARLGESVGISEALMDGLGFSL